MYVLFVQLKKKRVVTWYGTAKVGESTSKSRLGLALFPLHWQTMVVFDKTKKLTKSMITQEEGEKKDAFVKRKKAFKHDKANLITSYTAKGVKHSDELSQHLVSDGGRAVADAVHHFFWLTPAAGAIVQAWLLRRLPAAPIVQPTLPKLPAASEVEMQALLDIASDAGMRRSLSLSRLSSSGSLASAGVSLQIATSAGPPGTGPAVLPRAGHSTGSNSSGGDSGSSGPDEGHAPYHCSVTILLAVEWLESEGYKLPSHAVGKPDGSKRRGELGGAPKIELGGGGGVDKLGEAKNGSGSGGIGGRGLDAVESELERKWAVELGVASHRTLQRTPTSTSKNRRRLWVGAFGRTQSGKRLEPGYIGCTLLGAGGKIERGTVEVAQTNAAVLPGSCGCGDPACESKVAAGRWISVPLVVYSEQHSTAAAMALRLLEDR